MSREPDSGYFRTLPIALDAMGGDCGPEEVVAGAIVAVRDFSIPVALVGPEDRLRQIVSDQGSSLTDFTFVDAPDVVTMEEHAVAAVRQKSRASIHVALWEVHEGRASAMVSAGHSGAVVAASLFTLGRIDSVERPGIAIPFPTRTGQFTYIIDVGAVSDPRPSHLISFAYLVVGYLRAVHGIAEPRIGLLSNGEEPEKGNHLTNEVHRLLVDAKGVNFVGSVEPNQIPDGQFDAVVCDGFTGNILLKTAEGAAALLQERLRQELTKGIWTKLLASGLRPAFRRAVQRLDYREYGGAPLLGVQGVVIIAHGRSERRAITNAIRAAHNAARIDVIDSTARLIAQSKST